MCTRLVEMRVAVIAGSLMTGIRIATEVERISAVDVYIVCCDVEMRSPFLRWLREFVLVLKSFRSEPYITKLWKYARSGKLAILHQPLNNLGSVERLRSLQCDIGLHAANVIYREATIAAFRLGILNAHIGILPGYRGRSVAEWSVLQGDPTGTTVFFIDNGIDTGPRIVVREFTTAGESTNVQALKAMLFSWDARLYRKALQALLSDGFQYTHNDVSKGKRYYVMSRTLTGAVDAILKHQ
jgi:Formyl transferase